MDKFQFINGEAEFTEELLLKWLGKNVKRLRIKYGISREHVADYLGMSIDTFRGIERGEVFVDSYDLFKLSKVLCVSTDTLLRDPEKIDVGAESKASKIQEMTVVAEELSVEGLKYLIRQLKNIEAQQLKDEPLKRTSKKFPWKEDNHD